MSDNERNHSGPKAVPALPKPAIPAPAAAAAKAPPGAIHAAPTSALIGDLASQTKALVTKEMELAKLELKEDLRQELVAATRLGIAGLAGFLALNLLLVTCVLALAHVMANWGAGLLATGVMLVVAAAMAVSGWKRITRAPLERTRRTLKEDARWAKERLA